MIAALPLGRSTLVEPAQSAGSVDITDAADAAAPTFAAANPPKVPNPPKKIRSLSRVQNNDRNFLRDLSWRDERWTAHAYAWPDDRYLRGRYSRSWQQMR
jgi:hypothetical protein